MGNADKTKYQNIHLTFYSSWTKLISAKQSNDKKAFHEIMLNAVPELKKYIARRLKVSIKKGELPADKYQVNEFIDSVFIDAYDHFSNMESSNEFANWVYSKVDETLEDTVVEEEFNDLFFENMDTYTELDWQSMQENYSIDGGGDFIMEEELNDPTIPNYNYHLKDVFIDHKEIEILNMLDEKLKEDDVFEHMKLAVHNLPFDERVPFEMHVAHKINLVDIAQIQKKEISLVNKHLDTARGKLVNSFKTRFLIS